MAGVAGGVAGAVVVKLTAFRRGCSFSSFGGESEGSTKCGGCGNRESEKVDGVVCVPFESEFSAEGNEVVRRGERRGCVEVTGARGGGGRPKPVIPLAAGGFGSFLIDLKVRTLSEELQKRSPEAIPPCLCGSADCDRRLGSGSGCCWVACGGDGGRGW